MWIVQVLTHRTMYVRQWQRKKRRKIAIVVRQIHFSVPLKSIWWIKIKTTNWTETKWTNKWMMMTATLLIDIRITASHIDMIFIHYSQTVCFAPIYSTVQQYATCMKIIISTLFYRYAVRIDDSDLPFISQCNGAVKWLKRMESMKLILVFLNVFFFISFRFVLSALVNWWQINWQFNWNVKNLISFRFLYVLPSTLPSTSHQTHNSYVNAKHNLKSIK